MKKSTAAVSAVVLAVAGVGGYLYWLQQRAEPADAPAPIEAPVVTAPEPQAPAPEPAPHYPIAAPEVADAAGAEVDPDAKLLAALRALFGASVDTLFNSTDIVRRIVVTVDNLPREKVARRLMPVKPVPGPTATAGSGDTLVLDESNAARYRTYIHLVDTVPTAAVVDAYVRNYPAFQQRYVELGYPDGYFNNRLVEVIDHLLAAPELAGPLRLAQPKVLYTFADPELEKLSEGQKIMLRMGPDNAARVKAKLREIRAAVTKQAPGG
ncbi:DUF3014 domain-containing protein [Methyloversatilis discipulorum]|jgi:hypothetical protein|uniref:DUF3014 domain-containing protein n=1 Tax=Methyloversatilis discipulorum TaxID=1119528 RepID=UPI003AF7C402